ncbi:hypothetical protein [Actinoplanes rectilineatus]|uniref:hypothetical protein n=1 Tax=Actinoplanes rectilineatus TaxID=113571 RepID=UPI0005F29F51|nr:hypothetical protein [Actinoplanes rectilineatus]
MTAITPLDLTVGQQLRLGGDPHPWTVRAVSEYFAVLTLDLASRTDTIQRLYTVLDWRNGVRGPCNLSGQAWGDGTYSTAECAEMLAEFEAGRLEVSHRNQVRIDIAEVLA